MPHSQLIVAAGAARVNLLASTSLDRLPCWGVAFVATQVNRKAQQCVRCGRLMFEFVAALDGHFGLATEVAQEEAEGDRRVRCPHCHTAYRLLDRLNAFRQPVEKIQGVRRFSMSKMKNRCWAGIVAAALGCLAAGMVGAELAQMPPEQAVEVRGQKIVFYEAGQGATVVLLHGLGAEAGHWAANIDPLAKEFHVVVPDQVGFGRSAKPLASYTIQTFADYLHDFLVAEKISHASLVGNSLGGWIATDFALRYPEMVEKLALVDAAGLRPEPAAPSLPSDLDLSSVLGLRRAWKFIEANKQWATEDLGAGAFERHVKNGDGYTIASTVANMVLRNQFEDSKLGSIRAPTLVIWGREDALIPLSFGERFHKGIPGSKLVVIKNCGHLPQMQKPKEFNKVLIKFLKQ